MENIIINAIKEIIADDDTDEENKIIIDKNTPLIGGDSPLDSMSIVNLCIKLEEVADEQGFNFDWSGETMSKSKSMFRSVKELAIEFNRQKNS